MAPGPSVGPGARDPGPGPGVMAILNVTPDSFSDGGRFGSRTEAADEEASGSRSSGPRFVDIGGESTRPRGEAYGEGATGDFFERGRGPRSARPLSPSRHRPSVPISVDTRRASVARAALDAGADVVNVVTGLDVADDLLGLVASRGAAIVLNHCRGTPSTTFEESSFSDVVAEVASDLRAARERAIVFGIRADKILLDPGLGFGKNADQNFELLSRLADVAPPGTPLVVGASRKAFLGSLSDTAAVGPAPRVARRGGRRRPRRRDAPALPSGPRRRRDDSASRRPRNRRR